MYYSMGRVETKLLICQVLQEKVWIRSTAVHVVTSLFQHDLVVFWVEKTNPYPNQTLTIILTLILALNLILTLTLTLFQFKVEQFEEVFWRHDMNCGTYSESLFKNGIWFNILICD